MNSKRAALDVAVNRPVNDWLKLESCAGESLQVPVLKIERGQEAYRDSLLHPLMKCRPMTAAEVAERKWAHVKEWEIDDGR